MHDAPTRGTVAYVCLSVWLTGPRVAYLSTLTLPILIMLSGHLTNFTSSYSTPDYLGPSTERVQWVLSSINREQDYPPRSDYYLLLYNKNKIQFLNVLVLFVLNKIKS